MRKKLHDFDKMLEGELRRIKNAPISKKNRQLILRYTDYNISRGLSKARTLRIAISLRLTAMRIKKDFTKFTRSDMEKLFLLLRKEGKSEASIETDKIVLKTFFKWLYNGEEPECTKWFKCSRKNVADKLPEHLLVQEDIKKMIKFASNKRDKALIAVLWESGARIGEIGGMQIKDVVFDEFGCRIIVSGKTGMRRIRLVNAAPYLIEWINSHPNSNDPEAPLWVSLTYKVGSQLTHRCITKMLRAVARRAGIKKPVNPHNFRHSRATFLAQYLTEALLKEYFGWVQDSKMAARYIHLSGKQIDDAILKMHGLKKDEKKEDILKQVQCPRCKHMNDPNNEICERCWLPLKPSVYREVEKVREMKEESSVVLMQLLELAKTLSKANPDKVQQILASMQQQLLMDEQRNAI